MRPKHETIRQTATAGGFAAVARPGLERPGLERPGLFETVGPVPSLRCSVGPIRPGARRTRATLDDVIRAVQHEVQSRDLRKVADIVMYLLDTGRVTVDGAAND